MAKIQNWPSRLDREIKLLQETPFQYGVHDCCLSALRIAQTIVDRYDLEPILDWTEETAETRLIEAGGIEGAAEQAATIMGWSEIAVNRAQRGDLVIVTADHRGSQAMGLVTGNKAFVAAPIGWAAYSRVPYWLRAWRVE